jgi:RHS repeat-associated protein
MKCQEVVPNSVRFAAREYDAETGLYFNRARYYDPQLGRFISEDPVGLEGGINPYVYAGNDLVNHTDPYGLSECRTYRRRGTRVIVGNQVHEEPGYDKCSCSPGSTCTR